MKKIVVLLLFALLKGNICSQGYPVMDISNILAAIENGYTMYQQLQTMYAQIQNAYDQFQQQVKNFQNLKMGDLDITDPLGSWSSLMTYADRLTTYEENIERILSTKTMQWGRNSFSLEDLYTTNPFGEDGFLNDAWEDPFERQLSSEEKALFHQKYGMSYGHYMRYNAIGAQITEKAGQASAYFDNLIVNMNEDRERLDTISSTEPEADSIIKQQQRSNAIMTTQAQDTKTIAYTTAKIGEILAAQAYQMEIERQSLENRIGIQDLEPTEGFLKYLKTDDSLYK